MFTNLPRCSKSINSLIYLYSIQIPSCFLWVLDHSGDHTFLYNQCPEQFSVLTPDWLSWSIVYDNYIINFCLREEVLLNPELMFPMVVLEFLTSVMVDILHVLRWLSDCRARWIWLVVTVCGIACSVIIFTFLHLSVILI